MHFWDRDSPVLAGKPSATALLRGMGETDGHHLFAGPATCALRSRNVLSVLTRFGATDKGALRVGKLPK